MAISFDEDSAFGKIQCTLELTYSVDVENLKHPQQFMEKEEDKLIEEITQHIDCDVNALDTRLFFYEYKKSQEFDDVHIATLKVGERCKISTIPTASNEAGWDR